MSRHALPPSPSGLWLAVLAVVYLALGAWGISQLVGAA